MRGQDGGERGIILEMDGRDAVVLTPAGDFRRVRLDRPGCRVGDEIPLSPARAPLAPRRLFWPGAATVVTAAALLALVVMPALQPRGDAPELPGGGTVAARVMAYVTVDINPSVELAVDGAGRVVAARALNGDAEGLLAQLDLAGRPVEEAVARLADVAAERGFLSPDKDNDVVIAAVPAEGNDDLPPAVRDRVEAGREKVREALSRRSLAAEVVALAAPAPELKAEADRAGLSVGKYLILLEMQKSGLSATPEDLRGQPIGKLIKGYGLKPGEVIRRAEKDEEMKDLIKAFRARLKSGDREGDDGEADDERQPGEGKPREERGKGLREGVDPRNRGGLLPPGAGGERGLGRDRDKDREKEDKDTERDGEDRDPDGLPVMPEDLDDDTGGMTGGGSGGSGGNEDGEDAGEVSDGTTVPGDDNSNHEEQDDEPRDDEDEGED